MRRDGRMCTWSAAGRENVHTYTYHAAGRENVHTYTYHTHTYTYHNRESRDAAATPHDADREFRDAELESCDADRGRVRVPSGSRIGVNYVLIGRIPIQSGIYVIIT